MAPRFDLVKSEGGGLLVSFVTESDLRDGLHAYGEIHGWEVQSEVPVGSWGRIDLVFTGPTYTLIVELKTAIPNSSSLRKGLAQVHGHRAAYGEGHAILCAPDVPDWAADMADVAYPDVLVWEVGSLMSTLRVHGGEWTARLGASAVRHELAVRAQGLVNLHMEKVGAA